MHSLPPWEQSCSSRKACGLCYRGWSFLYACGDLATAVQYGINLVTIVFNDQAFGSTKSDQQRNYQGRIVETDLKILTLWH